MAQPLELDKLYSPEFSSSGVKPVGPVEIDWSNPLTKGLKLCWLAGNNVDLVTGRQATSTAPTSTTSGYLAADGDGSSSKSVILPEVIMETEASFVLNVHRRSDVPSNSDYIFDHDNATSRTLFYQLGGTNSYEFYCAGGKMLVMAEASLLPLDEPRNIVFTWKNDDATRYRGYSDGTQVSSASGTSKTGAYSFIPHLLERYSSASHLDGTIPYFYYYDRKLSADEVKLLNDNPYQILKPANSNLYLVPSAGGGATDITANGSMSFGSSAGLNATGTLAGISSLSFGSSLDLNATGVLSGAANLSFGESLTLKGVGSLSASDSVSFGGSGAINATGSLASTGNMVFGSSADLSQASANALNTTASITFGANAALSATGTLSASSNLRFGDTLSLNATGVLSASSSLTFGNSFTLSGVGALQAEAPISFGSSAELTAAIADAMIASAAMSFGSSATLNATGTLTATGGLTLSTTAVLSQPGAAISVEGLEYTMGGTRLHFTISGDPLHYTIN